MTNKMRAALELARKRIEYLGTLVLLRHRKENEETFFPIIDYALAEPAPAVSPQERASVIEECAQIADIIENAAYRQLDGLQFEDLACMNERCGTAREIATAIRALAPKGAA